MTRDRMRARAAEATSLLKQAKAAVRLAEKYRRDEEGFERNMDEAADLRRRAQDLLDNNTRFITPRR